MRIPMIQSSDFSGFVRLTGTCKDAQGWSRQKAHHGSSTLSNEFPRQRTQRKEHRDENHCPQAPFVSERVLRFILL
jgi:hypothetical protein